MDTNIMKNMIVLKNLQSNMIDEAYIVFKNNVKIKDFKLAENKDKKIKNNMSRSNDYMVKEAEMLINDYILNLENKDYKENDEKIKNKYNKLKIISIFFIIFSLLNFALFILK